MVRCACCSCCARCAASSAEALKAEVERLKGVQAHLQQLDKEAARTKSRPKKGSDPVADMLVELQAYRRQAVE